MIATGPPRLLGLPALVHVLGAMLLVGALVLAVSALVLAWRDGDPALVRLGYRSLLLGVLPAWIVMRAAAEWIAVEGGPDRLERSPGSGSASRPPTAASR